MSSLKGGWCPGTDGCCPGNAEECTDGRHQAAYAAWALLEKWGDLDEWERFEERDGLECALSMSSALAEEQLVSLRNELNWSVGWDELTGVDARVEGQLREALFAFVEGSRQELAVV